MLGQTITAREHHCACMLHHYLVINGGVSHSSQDGAYSLLGDTQVLLSITCCMLCAASWYLVHFHDARKPLARPLHPTDHYQKDEQRSAPCTTLTDGPAFCGLVMLFAVTRLLST